MFSFSWACLCIILGKLLTWTFAFQRNNKKEKKNPNPYIRKLLHRFVKNWVHFSLFLPEKWSHQMMFLSFFVQTWLHACTTRGFYDNKKYCYDFVQLTISLFDETFSLWKMEKKIILIFIEGRILIPMGRVGGQDTTLRKKVKSMECRVLLSHLCNCFWAKMKRKSR